MSDETIYRIGLEQIAELRDTGDNYGVMVRMADRAEARLREVTE